MCVCLSEGERNSVKSERARLQAACALNRPGSRNMPEGPRRAAREKNDTCTHVHTLSLVKGQCFSQRELLSVQKSSGLRGSFHSSYM